MVNILHVEDDKDLNQIICKHLNTHGYQMTGCYNVLEAYDQLYSNHIDMIISDIMMKEIDGFVYNCLTINIYQSADNLSLAAF